MKIINHLLFKRILAYIIDYFIILAYGALLFFISFILHNFNDAAMVPQHPINGSLINLITLTIPVFFYFFLFEKGQKAGTLGKRLTKIYITNNTSKIYLLEFYLKYSPGKLHM